MNKAKEYLREIQKLKKTVDDLEDKIELLRIQAAGVKGVTYDKDKVQVSAGAGMDDYVIALAEAEEKYKRTIVEYHEAVLIRTKQIAEMENSDYSQILLLRYVAEKNGRRLTLDEVARKMGYSFDWVAHKHGEALEEFENRYLK